MNPRFPALIFAFIALLSPRCAVAATPESAPSPRPDANDTYTITSRLELVPPFDLKHMTDDFQEARVITRAADSCTVEITYFPLHRPTIGENPHWRGEYAGMTEYLRPTATENWDEAMRRDLLAELRVAGIEPERLTDRQLVEQVSRWAMKRSRTTEAFAVWTIHFPEGKPAVFPELRSAFDRQRREPTWSDEQMIGQEAVGRSMFYEKVRGSCTSSSIYLTTIFRALGIPTRIVFCIPPFDANDPAQAEMFYGNIRHHRVRETVRKALDGMTGFANHLFNEVYVGHRWVRLNYATLGQPILDERYFGLLTHILTSSDLSQVPLAETWGMRYFRYPAGQPRLSSVNPYRLISVRDRFGDNSSIDNPLVPPPPELTKVTIIALLRPDSPELPAFISGGWKAGRKRPDFLISFREWMPGDYRQMRVFQKRVGQEFVLTSAGHSDLRARLLDMRWSKGDGSFQAFSAEVVAADRAKIVAGAAYTIAPVNVSETYRWEVGANLSPLTLVESSSKK
jgi:hypothetical protein